MSQKFHSSIVPPPGMTKRDTVLDLMRIAGYENDEAKFVRLLIENPISRQAANEAWRKGQLHRLVTKGQRVITIKCEDDSPSYDQKERRIIVDREDDHAWHGRPADAPRCAEITWPKFAWKEVPA